MTQENKIKAEKLSPTTDSLPSDRASCPACGTQLGINPEDGQIGCPHVACCNIGQNAQSAAAPAEDVLAAARISVAEYVMPEILKDPLYVFGDSQANAPMEQRLQGRTHQLSRAYEKLNTN